MLGIWFMNVLLVSTGLRYHTYLDIYLTENQIPMQYNTQQFTCVLTFFGRLFHMVVYFAILLFNSSISDSISAFSFRSRTWSFFKMLQTSILYREHVLISVCDRAKYSTQNTVYSMLHTVCNMPVVESYHLLEVFAPLLRLHDFVFDDYYVLGVALLVVIFCYNRTIPSLLKNNTIDFHQ